MPISCRYTKPDKQCASAEWVIAFLCDKCEADGTADVCDQHYHRVYTNPDIRLACGDCHGTLSFVAERLDHGAAEEVIN
jgi:hypothetical protein